MKISTSLLLAVAAGSAITGWAQAQQKGVVPSKIDQSLTPIDIPNDHAIAAPAPEGQGGFSGRVNATVYSTGTPTETGGTWAASGAVGTACWFRLLDDVSFNPGPGSGGGFPINGIAFSWLPQTGVTTDERTFDARFIFWNNYVAAGQPPWTGGQVGTTQVIPIVDTTAVGYLTYYPDPIAIPAPFNAPADANCVVLFENLVTSTQLPNQHYTWTIRNNVTAMQAGSTDTSVGLQTVGNFQTNGDAGGFGVVNGTTYKLYLKIQGDVNVNTPTCTSIGAIADSGAVVNVPASGNVQWYCLSLNGDAADDAGPTADGQFIDFDTEGSGQPLYIALFDSTGTLIGSDTTGDGSGTNAQMSYGIGRRAAVGDGKQYDGRDGELFAGSYYLAVAPAGAAFTSPWSVVSDIPLSGTNTVRIFTNTNNGALAPSVPPIAIPLGTVDGQAFIQAAATVPAEEVDWYDFTTCRDASGSDYLDLDMFGSGPITDSEIFIFNDAGNLVATDDDSGPDTLSQLSFGATAPCRPGFGNGGLDFCGQNGDLPAGHYYLGVGLFDTVEKPINADTNGRWHLRNTSGSSLDYTVSFTPSWFDCPAGGNCPWNAPGSSNCVADYNGSGGTPDDADVAAFFAGWNAGDECADANQSGGTPDDADIATFFGLWNAGGC